MLHVHRSERGDTLVHALGTVLAAPGGDPFAPEVVAVPSKGVERWLAQRLSHVLGAEQGDGVCANVIFPSHARLLDDAVAAADPSYAESVERWSAERSIWPLMEVIDRCAPTEPWLGVLAVHLGLAGSGDKGRRFSVASKLARHFAAYGRSRPEMLLDWHAGRDEQGGGTALPPDLAWQAELWRRLREIIGVPSPAELLEPACAGLRADASQVDLPERFSVFGATRISPARVQVLAALAERRDVHLWLHHPSPAVWDAQPGGQIRHPLLASMSRDVRGLQQLLTAAAPDLADIHHPAPDRPDTMLGRLQDDLARDRIGSGATDTTLTVHACHGPARQVEVLREVVLGLLAADETLEPRDVLVMCPDVETFAPLVAASFGMAEDDDGHPAARLRVRLGDRALRQTNPLLSLLSQVLELAANRVTATQLLDLAATPPVRRRFGFSDDDVGRMRDWAVSGGVRWGLDASHRTPYGLDALAQGTWRSGMDRLLLGVVMEEEEQWLGPALPLDDVDSGDIDLVGRCCELVDRVDVAVRQLERLHPVPEWSSLLAEIVLSLGAPEEGWQETQLRQELAAVADIAADATVQLGLADVTALLRTQLQGRPTRASFRTGALTVCTLVPMRSVPHRVVCLLGMDDGAFPRQGAPDGDDLLARDPRPGERDVRSEDRQLFLDAICAAQDHLVITYSGADPRTGAEVPPCVPLGELLDTLDASAGPDGGRVRDSVVVHHPLQPFAARNFTPPTPFSFDPQALAGARAAAGPRTTVPPLLAAPLGPPPAGDVSLEDLVRFLQHPARAFLRQRLEVILSRPEEEPADALPLELRGLRSWAIGDRVLRRRLGGTSASTCKQLELLRGDLPPGPLGEVKGREIHSGVEALLQACAAEPEVVPIAVDVSVQLPGGRRLVGTIPGVRADTALTVTYSRLAASHRLAAWVHHLALIAGRPETAWRSVAVGRRQGGVRRCEFTGPDARAATDLLAELVALRDAGLRSPLPMAANVSALYAERRGRGADIADILPAASKQWSDGDYPDNADPEHSLVYGEGSALETLLTEPPAAGEATAGETTRFGALAVRLWSPLIGQEAQS